MLVRQCQHSGSFARLRSARTAEPGLYLPGVLDGILARAGANIRQQPIRPGDFYFDQNGLMVFTAAYHLRRGQCCGSGCRHCPYRTE